MPGGLPPERPHAPAAMRARETATSLCTVALRLKIPFVHYLKASSIVNYYEILLSLQLKGVDG